MRKFKTKYLFFGIGILIGMTILAILISKITSFEQTSAQRSDKVEVITENGQTIVFSKDGLVTYKDSERTFSTVWNSQKMNSFFEYLQSAEGSGVRLNFSDGTAGSLDSTDELLGAIIDELTNGEGEGSESGGSIGSLFATPTPQGGSSGGSGGSGSGSGATPPPIGPSWCKHWKLSYCADKPTPSPTPNSNGVIQAKDCSEWETQSDKKTVISGNSCAKYSPSPLP